MAISAILVTGLIYIIPRGINEVYAKIPVDILLFFASFVIQREFVYHQKSSKNMSNDVRASEVK